jgi:hypothetical protein
MPKVTSLGHMGFYVRDVERSVAFTAIFLD